MKSFSMALGLAAYGHGAAVVADAPESGLRSLELHEARLALYAGWDFPLRCEGHLPAARQTFTSGCRRCPMSARSAIRQKVRRRIRSNGGKLC
ncbi:MULTISPECIES: hypothetical protein [Amycolatopsis]|uniref:Uncharacterized protein n=1 Tax=Amycolatopsis albidoflavus TaxID=102226 RepID=A0ABW5HTE7_9PSEU